MKVFIGKPHDGDDGEVDVVIHDYDTWNVDITLALVIAPLLKEFKANNLAAPGNIDDNDVPESMRGYDDNDDDFESLFERWDWIIDEMIWTFETIGDEMDFSEDTDNRINNGLRLFGKYFRNLWS